MKVAYKLIIPIFIFSLLTVVAVSCSKDDPLMVEEEQIDDTGDNDDANNDDNVGYYDFSNVDPKDIVAINTGASLGLFYNFWSTRPMVLVLEIH